MSSSASGSAAASSASASENLSSVLGSIGQSSTGSASVTSSASQSASASSSISSSPSFSSSATQTSATGSNTITDAPSLSTATSDISISHLTDLPTLSGAYSYPAPTVPPTQNAPYLQKTSLPENFIFIIVGAVIAFVALFIIAWRILTSWSINRRFGRYEMGGRSGRSASYAPLPDFKQKPPVASNHDMKDLGHLPRNFSSVPSLFFSPTAEVARHSTRLPSGRQESHGHLPAGHYRDGGRV